MKLFYAFLLVVVLSSILPPELSAKTGDTTHVVVMDKYLWTWNGSQDRWANLPDSTKSFEKILLRYTLTCPTGGCGEWDYTTGVILRKHTGKFDSTLQDAPSFTVDGSAPDSIRISHIPTVTYSYNTSKKKIDTTTNAPYKIYFFADHNRAFTATDSLTAWKANYWNYLYNAAGKIIDSLFVTGDETLYLQKTKAFYVFEVIVPYELTRFITPYGKGFKKDWTRTWTMDVTDYAFLLHDSVELRSYYDGYSQGSLYSLSLDFIEGTPSRHTYRADPVYNGYFYYGNVNDPINNHLPPFTTTVEPTADLLTFRLLTTGHGSDPNQACEFIDKTHSITVDGIERYSQHLWRDDCGSNYTYPQTGTFWYSRAGWCPGDLVYPWDFDLTPFATKNAPITVQYVMDDYESANPSGGYNVNGVLFYSSGPSFNSDAAIEDILQPTDYPRFLRTNPICPAAPPVIVIKNNGKQPLTSLSIKYGIDGNEDHTYQWSGHLEFLQKATVSLPSIGFEGGSHSFSASCASADDYSSNDHARSTFVAPTSYSNRIALALKTDKYPDGYGIFNGIRWELKDASQTVLYSNGDLEDATQYRDTFMLASGCYSFTIYDEDYGDGLLPGGFFSAATNGNYSLRDDKNAYIVNHGSANFLAEFGAFETTTFFIGNPSSVADQNELEPIDFSVSPNPATDKVTITMTNIKAFSGMMTVSVYSILGEEKLRKISVSRKDAELDLSALLPGGYILRVEYGSQKYSKKFIKQ